MSYDEFCGEYYDPRAVSEWECPNCGRVWQLIYLGYEEKWMCLGGGMQQDEEPMMDGKCPGCVLDHISATHLIGYAEEKGRRALVLRCMLSRGGSPIDEDEPVIGWAWDAFKASDPDLLAESVRDALWYERDQMIEYIREVV